jgi:LPS-assembly lipoprotein
VLRRALLTLALLPLAGCGWTPLYADRATGPADEELRAIRVYPISERIGQRLAWALRSSFDPTGEGKEKRYGLTVTLLYSRLDLGLQSQGLGTRGKVDIYATYGLREIAGNVLLVSGTTHSDSTFDITSNEYAAVVAEDDARNRAIDVIHQEIVARLTLFLQRRVIEKAAKG